ncbi:MAG: carboxypeptidase regulatory-like domain-containing protein [Lewinellaceae bacterium]|nr:carboxypeptidase regulatory-like domain-containing protein [Lewinellaceae bacterium]
MAVVLEGTTNSGTPVSITTVTDATGMYMFGGLQPGTYKISFVTPAGGYVPTANDLVGDASDSDPDEVSGMIPVFTVSSGDVIPTFDAGYFIPASIGNFAWVDKNADGDQDPDEPGLEGVQVMLTGTDGQGNNVNQTLYTDVNGYYEFTDLVPGTYKLKFVAPSGSQYEITGIDLAGGDDTQDSDANESMAGMTVNEILTSGEHNPTYDAGFYEPASVGDLVWLDKNANGVQDAGEPGIFNVTVKLQDAFGNPVTADADGTPVTNVFTDANGNYLFDNLVPGTYKVMFVSPGATYFLTTSDAGTNDAQDSDASGPMLMTQTTTLASGDHDPTLDAGFYEKAKIGNYTWEDTDGDGIQDPGENPLPGIPVTLTGTDGQGNPVLLTDVTDANGLYLFDNLVPGEYKLTFATTLNDYVVTDVNQGNNEGLDSDADATMNGMTVVEVLTSGEDNDTYDAGYYEPAEIGNYTWIDENADGDQDPGEDPLPGVVVILDGTTGSGEPVNLTASTDANGLYLFSDLQPGSYKLTFQTPLGGYVSTTANDPDAADDTVDSDADPVMGGMTVVEILTTGESNLTYDAGYYVPASIGDFVWEDTDADGVQDTDEPGIVNATVTLTGTDGQGNPVSATTTTDASGYYLFDNLVPGEYKLTFTTPVGGYVLTDLDEGGNDAYDSDADVNNGNMTVFETLTSGENNDTYDAGFYVEAAIGNYVWEDLNANGLQDQGEPGIQDVTVTLSGTTGSGELVNLTDITDANGFVPVRRPPARNVQVDVRHTRGPVRTDTGERS